MKISTHLPTKWEELKRRIALYLLHSDAEAIKLERNTFEDLNNQLRVQRDHLAKQEITVDEEWEEYKKSLTVIDLVREQLKGFNPKLVDSDSDILTVKIEAKEDDSFLADVHTLAENKTLNEIIEYLKRNQVVFTAKEAEQLPEINFGRSTINGMELIKDEITRLDSVYLERHPPKEEFDEHKVL